MIPDESPRVPPIRPPSTGDAALNPVAAHAVEWVLGGFGCLIALLVPLAVLALPRSNVVAVVAAPGGGAADSIRIIAEAGGEILNRGGPDNVLLARSDRADFAARLYAAGARLVLDGRLAEGCTPSIASPSAPFAAAATAWNQQR